VVLDRHVLAFHDADFAEAFAERGYIARAGTGGPVSDKSNHWHCRLLRPRRQRPRHRRAAEKRHELAPSHMHDPFDLKTQRTARCERYHKLGLAVLLAHGGSAVAQAGKPRKNFAAILPFLSQASDRRQARGMPR
jgi:hypothetical protein